MSNDDEARRRTDPEFDEWPVDAPDDHDVSVSAKWIGTTTGGGAAGSYVYDPDDEVVYEGELDEEAERVTVLRRSENQPEGDESLGEWMRRVGDDGGEWSALSEYASGELDRADVRSTFQGKNTTPDTDYAFFGSYSFPGDDGREHTVEREFTIEDADAAEPTVTVEERHLVDEPDGGGEGGAAEVLETRTETFSVADAGDERAFEEVCREWHASNVPV